MWLARVDGWVASEVRNVLDLQSFMRGPWEKLMYLGIRYLNNLKTIQLKWFEIREEFPLQIFC